MGPLVDLTLSDLLAAVASSEPSPGAGAAGAVALAMAIACARKAIRITASHHGGDPQFDRADERLAALSRAACEGGDSDAANFGGFIAALRLSHETDQESAARKAAIHMSAAELVKGGTDLIAVGDEVRHLILALNDRLDPVMVNDVSAALTLVECNRRIQSDNVAENRRHMG